MVFYQKKHLTKKNYPCLDNCVIKDESKKLNRHNAGKIAATYK